MANINKRVAKVLQKEFLEGTVFRVDLDRVDVAPDGSAGLLHSLPITGDRDKVKPGDRVRVINVAGERVALTADVALDGSDIGMVEDASEIELDERLMGSGKGEQTPATTLMELSDVDLNTVEPMDSDVLGYDAESGKWVPQVGGGGGDADTVDGQHASDLLSIHSASGAGIDAAGYTHPFMDATDNGAAAISFRRVGSYGAHFGLDTDNQFKVGGWSMGANAYRLFHAGNNPTGFSVSYDGGGSAIPVGAVAYVRFPCAFRAQQLHMFSDVQSTISVQIHKSTYDNWPTVSYLTTVTISNGYKHYAGLGTAWDAAAGDIWRFTVSANNNSKVASVNMWGLKL